MDTISLLLVRPNPVICVLCASAITSRGCCFTSWMGEEIYKQMAKQWLGENVYTQWQIEK